MKTILELCKLLPDAEAEKELLERSRELDREIARKLFGWLPYKGNEDKLNDYWKGELLITCCGFVHWWLDEKGNPHCTNDNAHGWIPRQFSAKIEDSEIALNKMLKEGWNYNIKGGKWLGTNTFEVDLWRGNKDKWIIKESSTKELACAAAVLIAVSE